MDQIDVPSLLKDLQSHDDPTRKLAVFNLQTSINDPALADMFISSGGLQILSQLITVTSGNTLAYALAALSRLLEVEMGWEIFESDEARALIKRIVELVVTNPLVNILRGAISILLSVVSRSQSSTDPNQHPGVFGLRALEPAITTYPRFFEMVVAQLKSADHQLCANSMMLLNASMLDAISNDEFTHGDPGELKEMTGSWPKFNKKLQELGIDQIVYDLMRHSPQQDMAFPLFEFQLISKVKFQIWKNTSVDLANSDHKTAIQVVKTSIANKLTEFLSHKNEIADQKCEHQINWHNQQNLEKWQNFGFQIENPELDFKQTGYLGLMDLQNFVTTDEGGFEKLVIEQIGVSIKNRFPFVKASLSVTEILYNHFEIESIDLKNPKSNTVFDGRKNCENFLRPMIFHWPQLHGTVLNSFFNLWRQIGAELEDVGKVADLTRVLVDDVLGGATRTKSIEQVEEELKEFDHQRLRELQIDVLDMKFEEKWGPHLSQVRNELNREAFQFVKEQRIRALLRGAWFPVTEPRKTSFNDQDSEASSLEWRYVKLSHNRRSLHFADFASPTVKDPALENLNHKIDLVSIRSVVSDDKEANDTANPEISTPVAFNFAKSPTYMSSIKAFNSKATRITINGYFSAPDGQSQKSMISDSEANASAILTLLADQSFASAWIDGLLMLINQSPITDETHKILDFITNYGMKIRMLNVRLDNEFMGPPEEAGIVPTRQGLDDDYFYEI